MTNDNEEVILEDEQVEDETVEQEEQEEVEETEQEEQEENPYRSKLNATNRFLQKEGYTFDKKTGWTKPETAPVKVATATKKSAEANLSPLDTLALIGAGVTDMDDITEVIKLSKGFGISIADALKDATVKHRLNVLKEERKTAEATNTRTSRSGSRQVDSRQLLDRLSKGEVPNTGSSEAEELYWARRGGRRK